MKIKINYIPDEFTTLYAVSGWFPEKHLWHPYKIQKELGCDE